MSYFRPERLAVVSLRAEDVPALVHFFRDVVGLRLLRDHGHAPAFDLGHGCFLAIVPGQPAPAVARGGPRFPVLAFAVKDLAEAVAHLESHDIEMPWGMETGASERWVMFNDPAGNLIEFVQFARSPD